MFNSQCNIIRSYHVILLNHVANEKFILKHVNLYTPQTQCTMYYRILFCYNFVIHVHITVNYRASCKKA